MKTLADYAEAYLNRSIKEVVGRNSHPQIEKWISRIEKDYPTDLTVDDSTYAWCGVFVGNMVLEAGGTPPSYPQGAKRWLKYGREVHPNAVLRGDIIVTTRTGGHHVTICSRSDASGCYCVGGNQGDSVKISFYPWSSIVGIRRP